MEGPSQLATEDSQVLQEFGRPAADGQSDEDTEQIQDASPKRDTSYAHSPQARPFRKTPAAEAAATSTQLRASQQQLQMQIHAAVRGRQLAEAALREVQEHTEQVEASLTERYETLLQEKNFELAALRSKLAAAEPHSPRARLFAATRRSRTLSSSHQGLPYTAAEGPAGGAGQTGGGQQQQPGVGLSEEDLQQLRREVEQQEQLLRGYQQENEAAMLRIKELEQALAASQAHAIQEVARLERHWAGVHEEGVSRGAEAAARLQRVLDLEAALQSTRDEAAEKEAELRGAVERLRQEKADAEARAQGVDLARMREEDALVAQVQGQMRALQAQHTAAVVELQAKLKWYAENQQLLDANDGLVAQQGEVIRQLEAALAAAEGPAGRRHRERVVELEAQVEDLQRALAARHPNSLPAVLAAAKPSPAESAVVQQLMADKEALQQQLARQQQEQEHALRALQQQYEALKVQMEERVREIKAAAPARTKGRVAELERQVEEQRTTYQRRIKALEARLAAAQRRPSTTNSSSGGGGGAAAAAQGRPAVAAAAAGASGGGRSRGRQAAAPATPGDAAAHQQGSRDSNSAAVAAAVSDGDGGTPGDGTGPLQQQASLQKLSEEVAGLRSLLQERSQQYASLQTRYYALEMQHRSLAKQAPGKQQQQRGAAGLPDTTPPQAGGQSSSSGDKAGARVLVTRHRKVPGSLGARSKASLRRCNSTGTVEVTQPVEQDGPEGARSDGTWSDRSDPGTSSDTDTGDAGDASNWQQRCRELQAANRQLRQQLIRVAHPDNVQHFSSRGGASAQQQDQQQQQLVQSLQAQLAAAQAAAVEAQQHIQQQSALALVSEGGSWRRALEAAVAEEQERWQQRVAGLEQHLEEVSSEAAALRHTLERAQEGWSPTAHDFVALERKLAALQADAAEKEFSWRALLGDKQELAAAQVALVKKRCEVALAAKDAEIEGFRVQLDSLLAAARSLHLQQMMQGQQPQSLVAPVSVMR